MARRPVRERPAVEHRQAGNRRHRGGRIGFQLPHEIAERVIALAAHEEIDARVGPLVHLGRQTRIVAADDDAHRRLDGTDQTDEAERRTALERHDREPDQRRIERAHQPLDRLRDAILHQHQIRNRHLMVRIDVAGQRRQRPVRHPHRERWVCSNESGMERRRSCMGTLVRRSSFIEPRAESRDGCLVPRAVLGAGGFVPRALCRVPCALFFVP